MRVLLGVAMAAGLASSASAGPSFDPPLQHVSVQPLESSAKLRPVELTKVGSEIGATQQVGQSWYGAVCVQPSAVTWRMLTPGFSNIKGVFGEELKAAGFRPAADPDDLFAAKETHATDLEVGAMIKSAEATACENLLHIRARVVLDVKWQVYSNLKREVVATVETHEGAEHVRARDAKETGRTIEQDAFAENVRALLANDEFRKLVTAPDPGVPTAQAASADRAPIQLAAAGHGAISVADAVGSVPSIFAGDGMGSGVLISADGYILTDEHVVGGASHVRVRWSDGFETTGDVVRTDKRRDVALIKTEPHGRRPLALNRATPAVGSTVWAIGTPLDPKLQSTVTRGVVSANRIVDGFSFIQSDVAVNHGNSGGPLLNDRGEVIGLCDWGLQPEGDNSHNFFTPIGDAMDFLALRASASTEAAASAVTVSRKGARRSR